MISRNITINGRRTTIRLDDISLKILKEIAKRENVTLHKLCSTIVMMPKDSDKERSLSMSSSIRLFMTLYYRSIALNKENADMKALKKFRANLRKKRA